MSSNNKNIFFFEDDCLMGFLSLYESVPLLISNWEKTQDDFLIENADSFLLDPNKAWNVYSIHITQEAASDDDLNKLKGIEENFRGTRKITLSGVKLKNDIKEALLPLLPIQSLISLSTFRDIDQLRKRISPSGGPLEKLIEDFPPNEIANNLREIT